MKLMEIACLKIFNLEEAAEEMPSLEPKICADVDLTLMTENDGFEVKSRPKAFIFEFKILLNVSFLSVKRS